MSRRSLGTLTLDLIAKIGGFQQGMDQAARIAESRSRRIENSMRGLRRTVTGVFAALGGAALVRSIVRATVEQENALRQLEQRIKSTGGAAGLTSRQLTEYANSLQKVTTFSDDAIVEAQGLLLTFTNLRGDVFNRATDAALDLSVALGQDLKASIQTLGRALNNPVEGISRLARAGISLDESQKKLIKRMAETGDVVGAQNLLLAELEKRFGGSAKAAADTFGGSLEQLKNTFNDLLEGGSGVDDATAAVQEFTEVLRDPNTKAGIDTLIGGIFGLLGAIAKLAAFMANDAKGLGEDIAALFHGPNADDVERIKSQLNALKDIQANPVKRFFFPRDAAAIEAEINRLQTLLDMHDEVQRTYNTVGGSTPEVAPGTVAPGGVVPPSEEFEKLAAQLKEQIALYGKTGEAAKLAYQRSVGALDELTEAEFQQVLTLARQYDSTVRVADAAKEAAQAQKQLKDAYESQLKSLEDQLRATDALTEADRIRIETTIGALKELNQVDKEHLISVAIRVDQQQASEDLEDINLQILELRGNAAEAITIRFDREFADERERFRQTGNTEGQRRLDELRALKVSKAEFNELQEEARRITEDLALQEERIRNSQETGANTEFEAMQKIGEAREQALAEYEELLAVMEAIPEAMRTEETVEGIEQMRAAIEKLRGETNLLAQSIESNLKEAFGDAFGDFLKGTKSAKDAFQSLIDDMRNRIIDFIVENLMEKLFGGISSLPGFGSGTGFGGFLGALFGGGRALGGDVKAGKFYEWQEGGREYFAPGVDGAVIPELALAGGGMTVHQHLSVPSNNGHVSRQTLTQISAAAARGLAEANRRNN